MLGSGHADALWEVKAHPALTDAETGLATRLRFELVYSYLFQAGNRGTPFMVLLVSTGSTEDASNEEIKTLGQAVEKTTRNSDLVSHVGSGRYVVLLFGTNLSGGRIAADRIELTLAPMAPGPISFGLSAFSSDLENSQQLLDATDNALLEAEAAGGGIRFG